MVVLIYIRLLGEGTNVFRPVPGLRFSDDVYQVKGHDIYDTADEIWEFTPGTYVGVEERILDGGKTLVAVALRDGTVI